MKAIVISEPGGPEVLRLSEIPIPEPKRGQVLVRVRATALNRADLLQRRGLYPAPPGVAQDIPGLEFAGEIQEDLSASAVLKPGQRVMGLLPGGGYAEYVALPAAHVIPIPESLSWEEAASIPEAFLTAFDAMCLQGELTAHETVLIHAVASGVGCAAMQIARQLPACVIGTSRQPDKLTFLKKLGLDFGIDSVGQDFAREALEATGNRGVNLIVDLIGGDHFDANFAALALRGRIILVGLVAGREAKLDLGALLRKRISLTGTVLRSRSDQEKADLISAFREKVLPQLANRLIEPLVDRVFSLAEVAKAHRYMEANRNIGKIVLTLD